MDSLQYVLSTVIVLEVCENDLKCTNYKRYYMIFFNPSEEEGYTLSTYPFTEEMLAKQDVSRSPAICGSSTYHLLQWL